MPTRRLLTGIAAIPLLPSSGAHAALTRAFAPWITTLRHASSSRWQARQSRDKFARDAKVQGLKSRAAFKLLQVRFSVCYTLRLCLMTLAH
jgi:hypothetical protein